MSDDEDLFGSSGSSDDDDDTDDLIAASNLKPAAKPKRLQKKSAAPPKKRKRDPIPDADNDSDDDDAGPGLFDDSDDDDDEAAPPAATLSKREKMEALRAKKRPNNDASFSMKSSATIDGEEKQEGYDSGDSYNSADFMRTKEDDDFIDRNDDDPDAINELYAEQNFHDERPLDWEEETKKKKKSRHHSDEQDQDEQEVNPIMLAVGKMKKKKRTPKKLGELEEEVKDFLGEMERAADLDDVAIRERRPATQKLTMLPRVLEMLARRDLMRLLLDFELLAICKRWIQPLPNGNLGNVTVRQQLLHAIASMTGNDGITPADLKRSEFGKVVMACYMHKSETPAMKRQHKKLIEQWSRPIFQKSGNMRDLQHVGRQAGGLSAIRSAARASHESAMQAAGVVDKGDIQDLIRTGSKSASKESSNRVSIPFSKGFQYSVRPQGRTGDVTDKRMVARGGGATKDTRGNLSKRMTEKGRASAKNQRSSNISIEGRPTK